MVVGPTDHAIQADIIFVIEGTAINGAYINDLKSNYIIPTLEYFSQGTIEETVCESTSTLYGIVTYQAADCLPNLSSDTYGPYTSPQKVLIMLEKIGMEFVGGKGESHANAAEGLATALVCFEDLQARRESGPAAQRHCVLVCSSPPYAAPARETPSFDGHNVEQLAAVLNERNIHLSILSPRKIPALFKLYEKAGGDLPSQTKNYAKDPRHLVLLKGYSLKERPISPGPAPHATPLPLPSMSSPLPNNNSPQPIFKPAQTQPAPTQVLPAPVATPQPPAQPSPGAAAAARPPGVTPFPPMGPGGMPAYPGMGVGVMARPPAWGGPRPGQGQMMPPVSAAPRFGVEPVGKSALIAQLTQPPNASMVNAPFKQEDLYFEQGRAGNQGPPGAQGMGMMSGAGPPNQIGAPQVPTQAGPPQQSPQPPQTGRERHNIWQGIVEWIEKSKTQNDAQKNTRHVPCQVSAHCKDGEPELKADSWPPKLIMQLMPKQLIGNIGGAYLKNSKSVLFHPQPCEALESLTKVMSSGFAGCVHFTSLTTSPCDIKVLILLYTAEKRAYLGFIPNDQAAFVDRLRKVIQNQKTAQLTRQGQGGAPGQNPALPAGMTVPGGMQPGMQPQPGGPPGMGLMARTLSGMNQPQNPLGGPTPAGAVVNQPGQGMMQATQQGGQQQGPQGGLQFNYQNQQVETARKQNLAKIEQLRQTLEAAQQQEQQFQKQIEVGLGMFQNPMKVAQGLQEQQMDAQFKNQLEEQQKQQLRAQLQQQLQQQQQQQRQMTPQQQQQMANMNQQQAANQQRMMRPAISNNPGLRHLLQQPQYRQQMPQMMQSMQRNPNNPQQFDDSTFDFLN